jgi:aldehyde:ferredoxin oxidoreductase
MQEQLAEMRAAHKVLAEFEYEPAEVDKGYTNHTLYVNLSDNAIASRPVTQQMKDIFIGGRGFGLWLLWNAVQDDTRWDDPENELNIACGPLGGTSVYPGSGKSLVVSISPLTHAIMDSNVGGHFGPLLKFSGWDALEIQGKADKDVIVFIDGNAGKVQILEAPEEAVNTHLIGWHLTHMFTDSDQELRDISVVSAGASTLAGTTRAAKGRGSSRPGEGALAPSFATSGSRPWSSSARCGAAIPTTRQTTSASPAPAEK